MASAYINISLSPELADRIRKVASAQGKSLSQFFREAAGMYLSIEGEHMDPAEVLKAYRHMNMIRKKAEEVQTILENVKKQCPET